MTVGRRIERTTSEADTGEWQFWIDVGGTFTDCFGRSPQGALLRHKLLSSGVTKGVVQAGSHARQVVDPIRCGDPAHFWTGYELQLLDEAGKACARATVERFDSASGTLHLDRALPHDDILGLAYELTSDEEAPLVAIRYLLGRKRCDSLPPMSVRLGTTRGTNALITRRGATTALVTTRGFGDILEIGYQNRPKLFELAVKKRQALYRSVVEIDERIAADGSVVHPADGKRIEAALESLKALGVQSLAICLLNSYANGRHEELVAEAAEKLGFDEISVSSRVAPLVRIVPRGDTTVMDAYLNPILRQYFQSLREPLGESRLQILTSAGGLVDADKFVGKDSILSGPAGGVVGFAEVAQTAGFQQAIGFDMGGTSTDVSRFDGRFDLEYETEKAGVRVVAPMMAIETVAAGGGSICHFDGVKLAVGPDSAGADPGPACYGRGGPLAVTDLNLFQGKIPPDRFPFPLDHQAVEQRLTELRDQVADATSTRYELHELAQGLLAVANGNMVQAIRSISIAKGCDPRDYVLVAFGGAAGQHACAVARELGVSRILNHPDAGILSAYGIGMADVVRHRAEGVYQPYGEPAVESLESTFQRLADLARSEILAEGIAEQQISVTRSLDLRYQGLDASLTVVQPEDGAFADAYQEQHERLYGYRHKDRPIEIVAVRIEVAGHTPQVTPPESDAVSRTIQPDRYLKAWFEAGRAQTGVIARETLRAGDRVAGPLIITEPRSTTVVDPGWEAEVLPRGELLLVDRGSVASTRVSTDADPILLEIFNNQFAGIAEQMGITLRNTSSSVNVKERLDFSCALFTAQGDLVVNAPHIPVHLGAMGETVRAILSENETIAPGDAFLTNDPYRGGAHLPDVTVVTPVFDSAGSRLLFFTASRAHHAEIGGIVPGSMPPFSKNLAEEGVLIANFKVVDRGTSHLDGLREMLLSGPYPTRSVDDNLADVTAQIAANNQGALDLGRLIERYTLPVVEAYMGHIQQAAASKMRMALGNLPDGRHTFTDCMDDGSPVTVAITIDGDQATIDFTGTGSVVPGNLNANRAIVTAAVMYVLRCLIDEDIPLNQGVLEPVEIILPECMLNPPRHDDPAQCAAVVGGNVETSQRVVDVLLGALGVAAASQGTMNNLVFGDSTFGYYETICGGAGATPGSDGTDAIHTHMTNTRLTDPEVMEQRFPVRLLEFSIRHGSGGKGIYQGGNGTVRRIEFLKSLDLSILSQRRGDYPPFGLEGGKPGQTGGQVLCRADEAEEKLAASAHCQVHAGDVLLLETPGGGGFGAKE
jgi:5-oxoprolinase (ATP-hydrolysing)